MQCLRKQKQPSQSRGRFRKQNGRDDEADKDGMKERETGEENLKDAKRVKEFEDGQEYRCG